MIRINLLPVKEAESAFKRRQQLSIAALAVSVLVLLMVVPFVYQKRTLARLDNEMSQLASEIAAYERQTTEAKDLTKKEEELKARLQVIKDLDRKRVGPANVLAELSRTVPERLWLDEFTESDGVATVIGWALDNQTVADFMRQLGGSPYFFNVDLAEATQPDNPAGQQSLVNPGTGIRFKRFIIKASVDYFGGSGQPAPANGSTAPGPPAKAGT